MKVLLFSALMLSLSATAQINDSFSSLFSLVANKSVAWNTLIDSLKKGKSLATYKLESTPVYRDPCQQIAQQGAGCPTLDYYLYFKRATGAVTSNSASNVPISLKYEFKTNGRPGKDTIMNIDTITSGRFYLELLNETPFTKRQRRKLIQSLFKDISNIISKYYGESREDRNKIRSEQMSEYWLYPSGAGALARLILFYEKDQRNYKIAFSTNLARR
jgi:hypothetical protein